MDQKTFRAQQRWRSPLFQFKVVILLWVILTAIGVLFYRLVLHWEIREALLQIVMTISTLGVQVRDTSSPIAEWFNIFYILAILFVALWGVTVLIEAMVSGELVYFLGTRRMEKAIAQLSNHYIICGFGRMGQEIANQLRRAKQPFVIIEHNPAQAQNLEASGCLYLQMDAREDDALIRAGVRRAKGLISVARTDEENVYITLSARVLNPKLYIVTRSSQASAETKFISAGANRVFSPYIVGGRRMAQAILHPSVVDFLDAVVHGEEMEFALEEVEVDPESAVCGNPLIDGGTDVEKLGVHVLGIISPDGKIRLHGLEEYTVQPGDTFILLGEPSAIQSAADRLRCGGKRKK